MTEDEQVQTEAPAARGTAAQSVGSRRPWVRPAMIEEDCAATESGPYDIQGDGGFGYEHSGA